MCELFGICAATPIEANDLLKKFYAHSVRHPHGWGLALLDSGGPAIEKEPVCARSSTYLKYRLGSRIVTKTAIAHIRYATQGVMEYDNTHPFTGRDISGRSWTLAHNGTIFDCSLLRPYIRTQRGGTDSERILLYIIDRQDELIRRLRREPTAEERFDLMDQIVCEISPRNKLNLLIFDGELYYVHCNYKDSLHIWQSGTAAYFATVPISDSGWTPVPETQLLAFRDGRLLFTGTDHGHEYLDNAEDQKYLYSGFSVL